MKTWQEKNKKKKLKIKITGLHQRECNSLPIQRECNSLHVMDNHFPYRLYVLSQRFCMKTGISYCITYAPVWIISLTSVLVSGCLAKCKFVQHCLIS